MPLNYLQSATGVYNATPPLPAGLGEQATLIVNAYLKRPEGLTFVSDASGAPIYMSGAYPTLLLKTTGPISAGLNVVVGITGGVLGPYNIGEIVILDQGTTGIEEACVIASVVGNNITLSSVKYSHASGATVSVGMVITEDRNMPTKRSIARVSKWPVANILSVLGRYAYGRRSDQVGGLYQEMNLLSSVQTFGGPPEWIPIPTAQVDWSAANTTGEIWVPAGMLMAYYSDVRIKYVAGYPSVPDPVVRATATIANSIQTNPGMNGQIKSLTAGQSKAERLAASFLDNDTLLALQPFIARTMF